MLKAYYLATDHCVEFSLSLKYQRQNNNTMDVIPLSLVLALNKTSRTNQVNIHLFQVNIRNSRKRCEICSELTMKTSTSFSCFYC